MRSSGLCQPISARVSKVAPFSVEPRLRLHLRLHLVPYLANTLACADSFASEAMSECTIGYDARGCPCSENVAFAQSKSYPPVVLHLGRLHQRNANYGLTNMLTPFALSLLVRNGILSSTDLSSALFPSEPFWLMENLLRSHKSWLS